jgi:hypothetical protein
MKSLLCLLMIALAIPLAARAQDIWTCTWPGFSPDHRPVLTRFKVQGDFLIEDDPIQESYRILQNNEYAIIATMAIAAIPPGNSKLRILSRTFVIDKSNGDLLWSNLTLGEPDSANKPIHGTCRIGQQHG